MTVFLMANCLPVLADGIGDNQRSDYPGVIDYKYHDIGLTPDHKKPSAGFSLQIKTPSGSLRAETVKSGNIEGQHEIVNDQDSPTISASIGDSIVISDRCTKGTGSIINQYDIQYRFVPEGSNREDCEIHSQIVSNFNAVKNIIEKLPLNEKGTYEIFMAVADNAPCLPGAVNWSANGNFRTINTSNKNFPNGIFWYFTEALVKVGAGSPDFYPTPEGSTEWKEEYKDPARAAKTYEYEQGATEITFPVTLRNSGEKAVTDFRAVWYGQGSDPTAGWQGTNPAWKSDPAEIELDKNGEQTFNITVPLPVPDGSKGLLAFKCNVNGNTPATETNQENNLMFIQIKPKGVDIKVVQPTQPRVFKLKPGKSVTIDIPYVVVSWTNPTYPFRLM